MGDYEEESSESEDSSEDEKMNATNTSGKPLNPRQRYEKDKMGRAQTYERTLT